MRSFLVIPIVLATASTAWAQLPGTFSPAPPMSVGRSSHTATMLRDGKVLIVGSGSADIYDPADGTFASAGNLTVAGGSATATLLADGRVLIAGRTTAELYDPSTGTFTRTADLLTVHIGSTATLLRNGKVLIAGGFTSVCCPAAAAKAELFDPTMGTFSFAGQYAGAGDGL